MSLKYYLIFAFFVCTLVLIECRKECIGRKGKNTVYCVCNTTYCDDLDVISKQTKGSVLLFQTSESGDRFKESKLVFSKTVNPTESHIELTLNKNKKYQKMYGFGAAFTDAAVINIDSLPPQLAQQVIKDYFSSKGIEFTIGRIPMAGTDFSSRIYTYDDGNSSDFELKNWKLADEDIKHKIHNIKLAQSVSPHKIKLFSSPWVTPKWLMDKNSLKTQPEKHYQAWANYFIKFLDAYKANGITIWGTTMQNEPMSFGSMGFVNASVERDFVKKYLGPALHKAGYTKDKFNLMVFDEGHPKNPVVPYVETILEDKEAHKYVSGIAYHCYLGHNLTWTAELLHKYPEQFIIMSECCQHFRLNTKPFTPSTLGDWDEAKDYIGGVINNMQNNVVGWTEWNLALDTFGHPNRDLKMADAPLLIDAANKEYFKNPNFYGLGHFSKFIAPDSVRVDIISAKAEKDFNFVAVERPDKSTVIVVHNSGNKAIDFVITDPTEGKTVSKIGGNTVQTYIYWN